MPNSKGGMTLDELRERRDEILAIAARHGAHNVRVFGSVPDGRARADSDVDFLVEFEPGRTFADQSDLIDDLRCALGREVDVVDLSRPSRIPERVRQAAVLLDSTECGVVMTEEEREHERLVHISENISRIERNAPRTRGDFLQDEVIQAAVVRWLETAADAASKLSEPLKARHTEIPWNEVYRFRNVAAHGYLHIDLDRVWEILTNDLPALKAMVEKELARFDSPGSET